MTTKTLIITFSLREKSQSLEVAQYLQTVWGQNSEILNLFENPLPLWDEGVWENTEKWQQLLAPIKQKITEVDSYIFVVPEYNGSPSPSYLNFMLFLGQESNHKPVLITTVSDSRGGAYPVAAMRSFGYKNPKINYIPEHLIIRDAKTKDYVSNSYMQERISYTLNILDVYATNFIPIRQTLQFNEKFEYGM